MRGKRKKYSLFQAISAVFMIAALLWLTVSAPFVYANQLEQVKLAKSCDGGSPLSSSEEESCNPFSNTTEEKTPSGNSFSEEYLHDQHVTDHFFSVNTQYHNCANAGTYNAFHGELLVPPPNAA